ncbi:polymer-forming cytoskeletal protein [Halobium salinum]|uniref:Polymer-forming cytoskeletal protein n=1 Tax=Halobium salinum TaxID=1364940 RepID=A0ABD5P7S9_9EURY|nr:polymer-forming cytoskeletal protein [Halobium salinum]
MSFSSSITRLATVLVVFAVLLGTGPGLALAQSGDAGTDGDARTGGVVTVAGGETHEGNLDLVGGTVLVAGTVDGDLSAVGGTVVVAPTGVVTGSLEAVGGAVTLEGTVEGDAGAFGGSVVVREGARVGGDLEAAAGAVELHGAVDGDARIGAEEVTLGPSAVVGGSVEYDAETFVRDPAATVGGAVTQTDDLAFTTGPWVGVDDTLLPAWVGTVYGLVVNLLLGAVLLLAVPGFSRHVVDLGTGQALRSGGFGLLTVVAVPVALLALVFTVVGIPLSLAGLVVFLLALWVGNVYGALAVGTWLVDRAGRRGRWLALAVGVVLVALVGALPYVGGVTTAVVSLLGLGALVLALRDERREHGDRSAGAGEESFGRPAA